MGKLQAISKRSNRSKGVSLTIGVDGRMYLSAGCKELLKHTDKQLYYLFYDVNDGRIGISSKQPDAYVEPFAFNSRGEGAVVCFVEDCEIQIPGKPVTWLYEGKEGDIYVFFQKGRRQTSFKQEKNGNLERLERSNP